jgi:hypothetical protein
VQKDGEEKTNEGAIMAQEKKVSGQDSKVKMNSKGKSHCFGCGAGDHWAEDCPHKEKEQRGGLFLQTDGAMISQFRDGDHGAVRTGGLRQN